MPELIIRGVAQAEHRGIVRDWYRLADGCAGELARELARRTGTTMTDAILTALEEKLGRLEGAPVMDAVIADVMNISRRCSELPTLDSRSDDEILGYGPKGV